MLKNRYKGEQGRDLHTHLSMGLPWFLQREHCGGAGGAPWATQQLQEQEQKAVVELPLAPIPSMPQHSHSTSCLRGLRLTIYDGHWMQICTMALPAGV